MFETLKLIHVVAAIVWVGGGILQTIYVIRARRADLGHRLGLARDMAFLGQKVFGPASAVALLFGIWMVAERPAFAFGDAWIIIGLVALTISMGIGGAYFSPKIKALIARLESGDTSDPLLGIITKVAVVDQVILLVAVWAMVVKPGA